MLNNGKIINTENSNQSIIDFLNLSFEILVNLIQTLLHIQKL